MHENMVVLLPMALAAVLLVGYSSYNHVQTNIKTFNLMSVQDDSTCSACSSTVTAQECTSPDSPVLGGVDLVSYFSYKNSDGTYDETKSGVAGTADNVAVYKGYKFYFSNAENKAAFNKAPNTYIPKYGGFCAYGVTAKNCPDNSWSATCLGPSGNWAYWTISGGSLYMFSSEHSKEEFAEYQSEVQVNGDAKWAGWYGESGSSNEVLSLNTQCYISTSTTTSSTTSSSVPASVSSGVSSSTIPASVIAAGKTTMTSTATKTTTATATVSTAKYLNGK